MPGALIAVLAATFVVYVLSLHVKGIDVVGTIPAGWPAPDLPRVAPAT
jgi:sulfate permease, SulP family